MKGVRLTAPPTAAPTDDMMVTILNTSGHSVSSVADGSRTGNTTGTTTGPTPTPTTGGYFHSPLDAHPRLSAGCPACRPVYARNPSHPGSDPMLGTDVPPAGLTVGSQGKYLWSAHPLVAPHIYKVPPPMVENVFFADRRAGEEVPRVDEGEKVCRCRFG